MNIRLRHDTIVRSLRRNGTSTIDALAVEVGASRRTILRDISALRDEGYVIHSDVGRGGGVQLDPQSMQTTAKLSVPEVFALLISVAAMRAAGNLPFSELADAGSRPSLRPCSRNDRFRLPRVRTADRPLD
jgi:predicted DNA-binding transcriptional regulator YafY